MRFLKWGAPQTQPNTHCKAGALQCYTAVDCPGFGPGLHGPGSGLDQTHRSECQGQWESEPAPFL